MGIFKNFLFILVALSFCHSNGVLTNHPQIQCPKIMMAFSSLTAMCLWSADPGGAQLGWLWLQAGSSLLYVSHLPWTVDQPGQCQKGKGASGNTCSLFSLWCGVGTLSVLPIGPS